MRSSIELIMIVFFLGIVFLGLSHTGFFTRVSEFADDVIASEDVIDSDVDASEAQMLYDGYSWAWNDIAEALR